jgi:hypothetical protein
VSVYLTLRPARRPAALAVAVLADKETVLPLLKRPQQQSHLEGSRFAPAIMAAGANDPKAEFTRIGKVYERARGNPKGLGGSSWLW